MTRWLAAPPTLSSVQDYRLAGTDWRIIGSTNPERRRYSYKCYRAGKQHAERDTLDLAMRYCERDGRPFTLPTRRSA